MKKIISSIFVVAALANAGTISLQEELYDYNGKFEDEDTTTATLKEKFGDITVLGSVSDVNRYGLNDQQYGVEVYSKLGSKEMRSYGYVAVYLAPNAEFLPKSDLSFGIYKGVMESSEVGFGYKRMTFNNSGTDILKASFSFPTMIIPSTLITETGTYVPGSNTGSIESKIIFNNENDLKVFYSYSFGNSSEDLGFAGIQKNNHYVHSAGVSYKINTKWGIGCGLTRDDYENIYLKEGGNLSINYTW